MGLYWILCWTIVLAPLLTSCTDLFSQDEWVEKREVKRSFEEFRPQINQSNQEIKTIIQELQQKTALDPYESSLLEELQQLLREREIIELTQPKES